MTRSHSRLMLTVAFVAALQGEMACGASEPSFYDYGPAPEFAGIEHWLNSDPLSMANLRGKVVLVEFWTYSCINCLRTLPYVTRWYEKFKDRGLVVIGVHTPEFGYEKLTRNVQTAMG